MANIIQNSPPTFIFLPSGIQFERLPYTQTFSSIWKGQVLFIQLDSPDPELEEKYKNAIEHHNSNVDLKYPDSGFDLFLPQDFIPNSCTEKIDYKIKAAMFSNILECTINDENEDGANYIINKPMPYYLYPRSSISKTPVRLANNVGIIDSGYRGNIGAYFDLELHNVNRKILDKHQRVLQICSNDLSAFKVVLIKNINNLGETERGTGGFGSTGR